MLGTPAFSIAFDHRLAFDQVHRQGLLAEHHLAGLGRGDGDLGVRVIGRANIDRVDIFALDQLAPVGLDRLVPPLGGEGAGVLGVAAADSLEHGAVLDVEEVIDSLVRVGMRSAHEAVTDDADIERFFLCHEVT